MNRVLIRASRIVAVLAGAGNRPCGSGEVAIATGLAPATASRLLSELHDLGWAERQGPRGSWILGPAFQALARRAPYRSRLMQGAATPVALLARDQRCGVVLACLRGDHRITLIHVRPPGRPPYEPLHESWDVWETAGGRLLAARLPPGRRRALIEAIGLPGAAWPGILTRDELEAELRSLHRMQRCERRTPHAWSMAVPVADGLGGVVSLGAYLDGAPSAARRRRIAAALGQAAAAIAANVVSARDR